MRLYCCRQAIKRAQSHMSSAQVEGEGLGQDGEQLELDDPEVGVRMDRTYPASLEREGFVGSSTGYTALHLPSSPEFELKAVGGTGGPAAATGLTAAALPREKAPLLSGGSTGLLALTATAASGSGSIQTLLAAASGASASRSTSAKQKISPKASLDRDLSRRLTAGLDGGSGEDGGEAPTARATRRHPSISSESAV